MSHWYLMKLSVCLSAKSTSELAVFTTNIILKTSMKVDEAY